MKIYRNIDEFEKESLPIVTIGTFDGVHLGHRKILGRLNDEAKKLNGESVLFTFYPHPRTVIFPDDTSLQLLNTQEEKMELLEKAGLNKVVIFPFTKEFSRQTATEFVRDILVNKLGMKKLVIGYDHHFGRNREGSLEHLKELAPLYDFEVEEIQALDIDQVNVSSTKIRKALNIGDISTANEYLGYKYLLSGKVIAGNKIGRTIGFPTANLEISESTKQIPASGVYAVNVWINKVKFGGMLNIGVRPTIETSEDINKVVEVHIFNFSEEIYEQQIALEFITKIRDEVKFGNLELLTQQLIKDKEEALKVINE